MVAISAETYEVSIVDENDVANVDSSCSDVFSSTFTRVFRTDDEIQMVRDHLGGRANEVCDAARTAGSVVRVTRSNALYSGSSDTVVETVTRLIYGFEVVPSGESVETLNRLASEDPGKFTTITIERPTRGGIALMYLTVVD